MFEVTEQEVIRIRVGSEYIYTAEIPAGCRGHRYRVMDFVKSVPSYQSMVLVLAVTGPDRGHQFVCSLNNFAFRYVAAETPAPKSGGGDAVGTPSLRVVA